MNKYKSGLDNIYVDAEMERRILNRLEQGTAQRPPSRLRWKPFAAAAVALVLLGGTFLLAPLKDKPPTTPDSPPPQVLTIPNFYPVANLADLKATLDFELYTPSYLPPGYEAEGFTSFGGRLGEIQYQNGEPTICYRTAKDTEKKISGDYNIYEDIRVHGIDGMDVTISANDEKIYLAEWLNSGLAFSLSFSEGVDFETCEAIVRSLEPA